MGLLALPNELLLAIFQLLARDAHISLCLVCRQLNEVCTPILYHQVDLSSPSSAVKLCRTLARSQLAFTSVKDLEISFLPSMYYLHLGAFNSLLRRTMMSLEHLVALRLRDPRGTRPIMAFVLGDCHFPHLELFDLQYTSSLSQEQSDSIHGFLQRHSTIKHLSISVPWVTVPARRRIEPLALPELTKFIGPVEWLDAVVPSAKLVAINGLWLTPQFQNLRILTRYPLLAPYAGSIVSLSVICMNWEPPLARMISELPNLQFASVIVVSPTNIHAVESREFVEAFEKHALPNLNCLQRLRIVSFYPNAGPPLPSRLQELQLVCKWHRICKTLIKVTLSAEQYWYYLLMAGKDTEVLMWVPVVADDGKGEFLWTIIAIVTQQYPGGLIPAPVLPLVDVISKSFPHWKHEKDIDNLCREFRELAGPECQDI